MYKIVFKKMVEKWAGLARKNGLGKDFKTIILKKCASYW